MQMIFFSFSHLIKVKHFSYYLPAFEKVFLQPWWKMFCRTAFLYSLSWLKISMYWSTKWQSIMFASFYVLKRTNYYNCIILDFRWSSFTDNMLDNNRCSCTVFVFIYTELDVEPVTPVSPREIESWLSQT